MFYSWYVLSLHFDYPYTPLFIYTEGILSVFKLPAWLDPQRYTMMLYVQLFLASVILSTPPRSCPSGLYYVLPNFGLWNLPILISLPFAHIWYPSITAHLNYLITLQPRSPRLPLLLHPTARPSPAASVKRLLTKLGPLACKHHKADRQPPAAPSVYEREHISKLEALQRGENHQHHSPANSISAIQAATPQQDDNSVNALSVSRDAATGCPRGLGHINYLMSFFIAIHQC